MVAPIQEASSAWNRQRYHSTVEQMQDINWACTLDSHANHKGWSGLGSWGVLDETPMALLSSWFTPIDFRFRFSTSHKLCWSAEYTIAEVTCAAHQPIEQFDSLQRQTCTLPSQKEQKKTPTLQKHTEETYYFVRDRNQGRLLVEDLSYILTVPDGYHSQMFCVSPLFHHTTRSRFQLR